MTGGATHTIVPEAGAIVEPMIGVICGAEIMMVGVVVLPLQTSGAHQRRRKKSVCDKVVQFLRCGISVQNSTVMTVSPY